MVKIGKIDKIGKQENKEIDKRICDLRYSIISNVTVNL
jgi:hypothetical protein